MGAESDEAALDWQALIEAAADCGMSEAEFWSSTPRWFAARRAAWVRQQQAEWERVRLVAYYTVKTVDTKHCVKSPEGLLQFPWEKRQAPRKKEKPLSAEEQAAIEKFSREADEWYYSMHPEQRPQQNGSSQ